MKRLLLVCFAFLTASMPIQAQTVSTLVRLARGSYGDGLTVGPDGNLYASEGFTGSVVLKITVPPAGQNPVVTEYATGLNGSVGAFFDSQGNLYVNSYRGNLLYRIDAEGTAASFATGLNGPAGIVINSSDEIFVSEYGANLSGNGRSVKQVSTGGTLSAFAGGSGLQDPIGIALDDDGNMYVSNFVSGQIYKITPSKTISLLADLTGSINQILYANGRLYVPSPNQNRIFTVELDGTVALFAGTGASGTKDGAALEATFGRPNSIAASVTGDTLFVLDAAQGNIRMIVNEVNTGTPSQDSELPENAELGQNYPNPFSSSTTINYSLAKPEFVSLTVMDLLGREVRSLVHGVQEPNRHSVDFDASGLPGGVYLYRLVAGASRETRTMTLIR